MKSPNITIATFVGFTNRGAEALLRSRISTIKKYVPSATFNVLTIYKDSCQPIDDVVYIQTFGGQREKLRSLRYLLVSAYNVFVWTLEAFRFRFVGKTSHQVIKELASSDLFISCDGDVLGEDYGLFPYLWRLYYLSIGFLLKKPVVIYAEGVGPFYSEIAKLLSRWFFNKCVYLSVRDGLSYGYLKKLGINKKVDVVSDSAFLLNSSNDPAPDYKQRGKKLIGLAVSKLVTQYGFKYGNNTDSYRAFLQLMSEVVDWMITNLNATVVLIPHVVQIKRDDFETAQDILGLVKNKRSVEIVNKDLNASQLKSVISNCDLIIASRMHAVIAGLASLIPVIGIAYSHKMHGVLANCGIDTVVDIKHLDWNITAVIDKTLNESSEIKRRLSKSIPETMKLAEIPAKRVSGILQSN